MSLNLGAELNMEAAQLVVGAAIIDSQFRSQLIDDRHQALRSVDRLSVTPSHVRLTASDRRTLADIAGGDLQEFARGVERLRLQVRPANRSRDSLAAIEAIQAG